ncbi:hypothetical protein AB9K35_04120 [Leisingera sp. XS_AS12]
MQKIAAARECGSLPCRFMRGLNMKTWKKRAALAAAATAAALIAAPAMAQDAGTIMSGLRGQATEAVSLVTVISFLAGAAIGIAGFLKFYANTKNPNDPSNKMSTAFILIFVGAGLVALPAVLGSGISTVFGSGADKTDGTSGFTSLN